MLCSPRGQAARSARLRAARSARLRTSALRAAGAPSAPRSARAASRALRAAGRSPFERRRRWRVGSGARERAGEAACKVRTLVRRQMPQQRARNAARILLQRISRERISRHGASASIEIPLTTWTLVVVGNGAPLLRSSAHLLARVTDLLAAGRCAAGGAARKFLANFRLAHVL